MREKRICLFLMKDRKGVGLEGRGSQEEAGGTEGGEMIVRMYCMRKEHFQ